MRKSVVAAKFTLPVQQGKLCGYFACAAGQALRLLCLCSRASSAATLPVQQGKLCGYFACAAGLCPLAHL